MYVNNRMNKYQTNEQLKKKRGMYDAAIIDSKFNINNTVKKNAIKKNTRSNANHVDELHKKIDINPIIISSDKYPNSLKYTINNKLKKIDKNILIKDVTDITNKKGDIKPNRKTLRNFYKKASSICFQKFGTYKNKNVPFLSDLPFFSRLPLLKDKFYDNMSADHCKTFWKMKRNKLLCNKFSKHTIGLLPICSKGITTYKDVKPEDTDNTRFNTIFQVLYQKVTTAPITSYENTQFKEFLKRIKSIDFRIYAKYNTTEQIKIINEFKLFNRFLKTTRFKDFKEYSKQTDITNEEKQELIKEFDTFKIDHLINIMNVNEYFKKFLLIKSIPFDEYSDYDPKDKIKLITEYDEFINNVGINRIQSDEFIDFLLMKSITFDKNTNMRSINDSINTLIEEFIRFLDFLITKNITFSEFNDFLLMKSIKFNKDTDMVGSINDHIDKCIKFHEFFKKDNTTFSFSEFKEFLKIIKSKDFHTYANNTPIEEKIKLIGEIKRFDKNLKKKKYKSVAKYIGDTDIKTEDKQKFFMEIMSKNNETNSNKNVLLNESILLGGKRQTRRKRNKHQKKNTISRCHL